MKELIQPSDAVFAQTSSSMSAQAEKMSGFALARSLSFHPPMTMVYSSGVKTGIRELDLKADIQDYLHNVLPPGIACRVYLQSSFFYENLVIRNGTKRVFKHGNLYIFRGLLPALLKIPMVAAEDIGRAAADILAEEDGISNRWCNSRTAQSLLKRNRNQFLLPQHPDSELIDPNGHRPMSFQIPLVGQSISAQEFVTLFSKIGNAEAVYEHISLNEMNKVEIQADDLETIQKLYHVRIYTQIYM